MAHSNTSLLALRFSKALFQHRHSAAATATAVSAGTALNRLHVDAQDKSDLTGAEAQQKLAAETIGGGPVRSTVEVAYDATKGTAERVEDTVIAEANENVVDTTEYRSMENMGDHQKQ